MMRIIQVLALSTSLGFLVGCSYVPGGTSETAMAFEDNAEEICEGTFEDCTPSEAIEVLELTVKELHEGNHAELNAAKVALDNGEGAKAVGHLEAFTDKARKDKKIPEDDVDFMEYVAQEIIEAIDTGE